MNILFHNIYNGNILYGISNNVFIKHTNRFQEQLRMRAHILLRHQSYIILIEREIDGRLLPLSVCSNPSTWDLFLNMIPQ